MGGIDKPDIRIAGKRLIDIATDAAGPQTSIVVVGPERDLNSRIFQTRESPVGGGPVAAVAAGLAELDARTDVAGEIAILAADVALLTESTVRELSDARRTGDAPAALALDSSGRLQYLVGVWSVAALRESLRGTSETSMRALIPAGSIGVRITNPATVADVDTPDDLRRLRARSISLTRVSVEEARQAIRDALTPISPARRAVHDAVGAVLAADVVAAAPFPTFDASAMDGYAVAGDGPWTILPHNVSAGATHRAVSLRPGESVRIATGAMLPPGADRVIRDEEVTVTGSILNTTATARDDTRRTGSEWIAGQSIIPAGTCVDAAVESVVRAAGVSELSVRGPLRVGLYSTGNEVSAEPTAPGLIADTASGPVADLLRRNGSHVTIAHLPDTREEFCAAIERSDVDLVILIGATGRGVADHLRGALDDTETHLVVDGINMRPGGSLLIAAGNGPVIVGLGGNPLAAVAGLAVILPTLIETLLAQTPRIPDGIVVADAAAHALDNGWRVLVVERNSARWTPARPTATSHLLSLVGNRALVLLGPDARDGDHLERIAW